MWPHKESICIELRDGKITATFRIINEGEAVQSRPGIGYLIEFLRE